MSTPHNSAEKGDIAQTVLMPGDPLRAKWIAETYLENAELVSDVRNVYCYTGIYKGKQLSVMASGMGMPSMGIYSWELFQQHGVQNIIRVGTAGSFHPDIHVGEVVLALAASTDSNYCDMFGLNGAFTPSASFSILKPCMEAAEEAGIRYTAGNVLSSDHFYEADPDWWKPWQKMGVLGVEMEAAALYANAAFLHRNALSIMTISDHFVLDEKATVEQREHQFTNMMKLALETAVRL